MISVTCWKTLILRLLEKLQVTLYFLKIFWCHKYWYLQIADIPPNSCLYIEGNFTQTKTPLTTILIIVAHKARKQIIPQSNLKFSMFKYRFLFHNRMYGKSRHLITDRISRVVHLIDKKMKKEHLVLDSSIHGLYYTIYLDTKFRVRYKIYHLNTNYGRSIRV